MSVDLPEPASAPVSSDTSALVGNADVPGLADTALRSALEFAVGIAAAGQKIRPPLAYPPGLKAYLKFSRLDRTSLRAVRRAVAGDEVFRSRLGEVATADLVDELGIAWLQRREGWPEQVRELQAAAIEEAENLSGAAALRKAERRREAAEQAAARASAELVGHQDSLAREQARRERAEAAAAAATTQLTSAHTEVDALRRDVEKAKRRADSESGRAERAEQALGEVITQLRAVEAMRDEVLAQRAARRPADSAPEPSAPGRAADPAAGQAPAVTLDPNAAIALNRAAAQALQQAAAATRDLADALATAGEALVGPLSGINGVDLSSADSSPSGTGQAEAGRPGSVRHDLAGVRPLRPKPSSRKPIAIPGGVYGDSLAAADHLLRTPQAVVIVDGYNVAKLGWPTMELVHQRELCIEMLEDLARRIGADIRVVFDGSDVVGASARRRLIRVQYSPPGVIADDVIRAEVRSLPATTPVVVVTNDQAIVSDVRAEGANPVSSNMLLVVGGRTTSR